MARVFAAQAGANWVIRVSRYKFDKWQVSRLGSRNLVNGHWRSVAVEVASEPKICHGCKISIAGRCASPGAALITNLSWWQEQMQKPLQATYLYCPC